MKNKKFIAVFVLLMIVALGGTAVAYMVHNTSTRTNEFTAAAVACDVVEVFDDGEHKTSVKVKNDSNIKTYIRVRLISYWQDSSGNIVGKTSEMPAVSHNSGKWYKNPDETDTYYYIGAVDAGDTTEELLAAGSSITLVAEDGYKQVVEIIAEAIQAEPLDAATAAWGAAVINVIK